jgi:hypothetical protein
MEGLRKIMKLLSKDSWIPSRESDMWDLEGLWRGGGEKRLITQPPLLSLYSKIYNSIYRLSIISLNRFVSGRHMKTNNGCVSKFVHKRNA